MKTSIRVMILAAAAVALDFAATSAVHALPIISNGGFESGLASWTRADQVGSDGTFSSQSGTVSPVSGNMVPAPPQGTTAAMTDALGPGSHILYQDFTATAGSAALSFAFFIGNRASLEGGFTGFATPASLDFSTPTLNQQARVDILTTTADPFSVAAGDVLLNLYQTKVGDPLISGYNTITTDITALLAAHVGETLRLRFAETDNVSPFQLGVDNVRFDQVQIPEPASILLFGTALALLVGWRGQCLLTAHRCAAVVAVLGAMTIHAVPVRADTTPLVVLDPNLQVTTVLNAGISQPIGIVFLAANDFLVLEKASGQIKRVINGVIQPNPVLDLAVNSNSERGLLSMVL
ncbi:MAG TPA: PEP-CTERM sorting domain-containing protein, partial [Bradyrhizobium sp.]|nr:PEP-CTERM sorting domain-containing protein [Bradyrhizobium sp.]